MVKPTSGDRDWGHWMEGACGIFALLLLQLLYEATNLHGGQPASPRGRGVPSYPSVAHNRVDGGWKDFGAALAIPPAHGDLRIFPNMDPEGQYNVPLVDQLPAIQNPMQNIDADNAAAAGVDLDMWLVVAEVVNLPRQIERDEANTMARRPQVLSSVAENGVAPSSLVDDVAAGSEQTRSNLPTAPQHLLPQAPVPETVVADAPAPEVVGILAGVLTQRMEDEDEAHAQAQVEVEVAIEAFPPGMLELISDVARLPQFATASMTVPAGDLESNLEERLPVNHPEAGDLSADLHAEVNLQDDVENSEIEDPHAKGMQ